jgi:HAE1 family hydrophobic/amphiphilic exporter-1
LRYTSHDRGGADAIGMSITKAADANTLETAAGVRRAIEQIQRTLPPGVEIGIRNDASRFVSHSVDAVKFDLFLAILLTGIVLFLFLHTWRNTIIVLISIPTCLVSTFLLMYIFGFTLNTISLMAMALMIGILVDDSIVVLENIARHLGMGENPLDAALNGRSEIGLAAIAITLTDVVVFVPISFMQGNIGKLFREFGLTIASATLLSLLVSFTLVPVLASRWLKSHEGHENQRGFAGAWERGFDRLGRGYRRLLAWALHHRPIVVVTAAALLIVSFLPLPLNLIGQEYAPNEDDGQFQINTEMPPGTSLAANSAAMARLEQGLIQMPEVEAFTTTVGSGGGGQGGVERNGTISVQLIEKNRRSRSVFDVMQEVRGLQAQIPGMRLRASVQSPLIGGGSTPISIRLIGDNMHTLQELAGQVETLIRETPGTVDIRNEAAVGEPEVRALLDRQRMADLGITATQVSNALRTAIAGLTVTQLRVEGQAGIDITVLANKDLRNDLTMLGDIPIPVGLGTGTNTTNVPTGGAATIVRLGQVADLRLVTGPSSIDRSDRQRQVSVSANLAGRSVGDAARDINAGLRRIPVPAGYTVRWVGQADQLNIARAALLSALVISVILVYMLLVALYESWLYPLAIMFSLPVALTGAFAGLLLTGNTFNVFSMIGLIMLMGLVAKNGILLVDFTNLLRRRGLARNAALLEAGPTRLRPIVMTTATVICAMMPLALKLHEGAESRAPMAVVLIGGVFTSTLLTLVLVPVMYSYLDDLGRVPAFARAHVPSWLRLRRPARVPVMAGGANGHSYPAGHRPSPGPLPD